MTTLQIRAAIAIAVMLAGAALASYGRVMKLERDAARESLSACNERVAALSRQLGDQNAAVERMSAAARAAKAQGAAALQAAQKAAQARENDMLRLSAIAAGKLPPPAPAPGTRAGSCEHALQVIREDLK